MGTALPSSLKPQPLAWPQLWEAEPQAAAVRGPVMIGTFCSEGGTVSPSAGGFPLVTLGRLLAGTCPGHVCPCMGQWGQVLQRRPGRARGVTRGQTARARPRVSFPAVRDAEGVAFSSAEASGSGRGAVTLPCACCVGTWVPQRPARRAPRTHVVAAAAPPAQRSVSRSFAESRSCGTRRCSRGAGQLLGVPVGPEAKGRRTRAVFMPFPGKPSVRREQRARGASVPSRACSQVSPLGPVGTAWGPPQGPGGWVSMAWPCWLCVPMPGVVTRCHSICLLCR